MNATLAGHPFGRRRSLLTVAMVVMAGTLGLGVVPVAAVAKTPFNNNLIKNPGFEAGSASPNGHAVVPIPSWGSGTVVAYGTAGPFPSVAEGNHVAGGHKFLSSGSPCAVAYQQIDLVGRDAAIDRAEVAVSVSVRVGSNAQSDAARVYLDYYGPNPAVNGMEIVPKAGTNRRLLVASGAQILPAGTRMMILTLYPYGATCDIYFDNVSVRLINMAGLAVGAGAAGNPTPYNKNVILNPGFETGQASSDGYATVEIPHWALRGPATVVKYGTTGGFPTTAEGNRIGGGHQFLASGNPDQRGCGVVYQVVALRGRNAAIDGGQVAAIATARIGTYDSQPDTAVYTLVFQTKSTPPHATRESVVSNKTATSQHLDFVAAVAVLPATTRQLVVGLTAENTAGYCDAYFDNVIVEIIKA